MTAASLWFSTRLIASSPQAEPREPHCYRAFRIVRRIGPVSVGRGVRPSQSFADLSRSAFPITLTDDSDMAAAAIIGDNSIPSQG